MVDLSVEAPRLGGAGVPVVPAQVRPDRGVLVSTALIVGAVEDERAKGPELALNEVQPARIGRGEDELDVVFGDPRLQLGLLVRAEVVEDDDQVLAEASPERTQKLPDLAPGLAVVEMTVQRAGGRVVGGHELAHAGRPRVRRPEAGRLRERMPAAAESGLQVQGAELIEAEHPGTDRWMGVQVEDPVLLRLELGVGGGLPGLVVGEADAGLVEDPPELAATDRGHDPGPDQVGPELGQTPARERLAPVSRTGEGHLHDLGPGVEVDPARSAPAPARVQGREPLLVEGVDCLLYTSPSPRD